MKVTKAQGELVFSGNGGPYSIVIRIGIADGKGGVEFGGESTVYIRIRNDLIRQEPEYLVQIGGLSSHSAAFARQRAAAYLAAASVAEVFEQSMEVEHLTPYETFANFARSHRLALVGDPDGFNAWEDEETTR